MDMPELTFKLLDARIEALPVHPTCRRESSRRGKWGAAMTSLGGLSLLVLGRVLPPKPWVLALLVMLLLIELSGLILLLTDDIDSLKLTFGHQRRQMTEILDFNMPHHAELIAWLRTFPRKRLHAMNDFAALQLERHRSKAPILTGTIDKLGALPVLAALAVQFKDMHWPPAPSFLQILIFALLAFLYWLAVLTFHQRLRLELYNLLLKEALA